MPRTSRLILSGPALVLCPELAKQFGKSTALVLQQLHYWLSQQNQNHGIFEQGHQWIRNSYNQWQKQLQLLSMSTIRRAFAKLESHKIIHSLCIAGQNTLNGGDQVKYYTIDYDTLEQQMGDLGKTKINRPGHAPVAETQNSHTNSMAEQFSLTNKIAHRSQSPLKKELLSSVHTSKPSIESVGEGEGDDTTSDTSNVDTDAHITPLTAPQNLSESPYNLSSPLFKMSIPPVHFEHPPLYITKTTSKKTSLNTESMVKQQPNMHGEIKYKSFEKINEQPLPFKLKPIQETQDQHTANHPKKMIDLWNTIIEGEPDKIILTSQRSRFLGAAFKQFFNSEISQWETFCLKIASSKFLMGEIKPFKAHLDWALRFDVIQKVIEGAYTFGDRFVRYTPTLKTKGTFEDAHCSPTPTPTPTPETQKRVGEKDTFLNSSFEAPIDTFESKYVHDIRTKIKTQIGEAHYRSWFLNAHIHFESFEQTFEKSPQKPIVYVASTFMRDRIKTYYRDVVDMYFSDIRVGEPQNTVPTTAPNTELQSVAAEPTKSIITCNSKKTYSDPINDCVPESVKNILFENAPTGGVKLETLKRPILAESDRDTDKTVNFERRTNKDFIHPSVQPCDYVREDLQSNQTLSIDYEGHCSIDDTLAPIEPAKHNETLYFLNRSTKDKKRQCNHAFKRLMFRALTSQDGCVFDTERINPMFDNRIHTIFNLQANSTDPPRNFSFKVIHDPPFLFLKAILWWRDVLFRQMDFRNTVWVEKRFIDLESLVSFLKPLTKQNQLFSTHDPPFLLLCFLWFKLA